MTPKALGLTLLGALQKRQDATCQDFCPFDTMTIDIAPTRMVVEQPIYVTGYFPANGPLTLAPNVVATITGAPGVIDTVLTIDSLEYETNTITVCPTKPTDTITNTITDTATDSTRTVTTSSRSTSRPSTSSRSTSTSSTSKSSTSRPSTSTSSTSSRSTSTSSTSKSSTSRPSTSTSSTSSRSTSTSSTSSRSTSTSSTSSRSTSTSSTSKSSTSTSSTSKSSTSTSSTSSRSTSTSPTSTSSTSTSPTSKSSTSTSSTSTSSTSTSSTSSPSTTASCVPSPTVCATALPEACASLSSANGLALVPLVTLCNAALGVFGTSSTAACLAGNIGLDTTGASIVACLNGALPGVCIAALPQACLDIPTTSEADLPGKVAACTLALGPFAVGAAAECLGTAVTNPLSVLSCLQTSIGLGGGSDACTTPLVPTSTGQGSSTGTTTKASSTETTPPTTETTPPTTVTTPTSTSCVPTATGPAPSACATGLPQACTDLGSLNGLTIVPALAGCAVALGPFAAGNAVACLATSSITFTTAGSTIVTCLRNALKGECITALPGSCTSLRTKTGLALISDVAECALALGPFAVGTALSCLSTSQITTTSTGVGIIDCLETALGLRSSTSPGGDGAAACTTTSASPAPTCEVNLPPECKNIKLKNGLALVFEVPSCVVALGVFGVGNAAACLATSAISISTTGVSIVECIENAFKAQCPKKLPAACTKIANDNLGERVVDIPLCTVALGPYAAGTALSCLSTSVGSGQTIVQCLKNAFGVSG